MTAETHSVSVPHRSDGVARALHAIYDPVVLELPVELSILIAKLETAGTRGDGTTPRR